MDPFRSLLTRLEPWLKGARWARLRAALLLWHALAVFLVAFPAPIKRLDAAAWQKPTMRAELRNWTARLRGIGIDTTEEQLAQRVTALAGAWLDGRQFVTAPFRAWLNALGTTQGWYMFTGADRVPQRFVLSLRHGKKPPELVFRLGSAPARPDLVSEEFLAEHRTGRALLRGAWSSHSEDMLRLCRYFERELRARDPSVDDVVCQLEAQAVEHPSSRGAARPSEITRTVVLARDGSERDRLDQPRQRPRKGKR